MNLSIQNRGRGHAVDVRFLRRVVRWVLEEALKEKDYELGVRLVGAAEMTRINETFLRHGGSTDVITFDYREPSETGCGLCGELVISLDDAAAEARRFRTSWQSELMRYFIHGVLHLRGHDDLRPDARRRMKREEDRLLRRTAATFPLLQLERPRRRTKRMPPKKAA